MSVEERNTASDPLAEPVSAEENCDWVTVQKRKITILVPPAPTDDSQSKNSESSSILIKSKRNSKHSEGDRVDPADRVTSKAQEPHQCHAVSIGNETEADGSGCFITEPTSQLAVPNIQGDGSAVLCSSKTFGGFRKPPIGTSTVVNRRLRALNLERKLQGLGGFRAWLSSQGLGRFVWVFEKQKFGKYQLANLTMSELKDMGIVAVGPRRKLIHAINGLCQPYYV